MKTIGLVCCHFGTWPKWADLFVESCRHNPTIDFYLVTDCAPRHAAAENIKLIDFDLPRFNALASEKLGIKVDIKRAYKLADFKPAYGVIFREYLEGHDFWGYCDLDIVFGNIRRFLTDELLDEYDVIATRKEFITGHFTLFRNVESITRLYESSRDHEKVFATDKNFAFDECGWALHFKLLRGATFSEVAPLESIDSLMHVLERSPDVRVHRKTICDEHLPFKEPFASFVKEIRWNQGELVDTPTQRDLMYYHLQFLKNEPGFYVPTWETMPEAFLITRRGVHWVGKEDLIRRLVTAAGRRIYFLRNLFSNTQSARKRRRAQRIGV